MFLQAENIQELHVEITNKCNAACPMCDRNQFGGLTNPGRGLSEWSLDDISKAFSNLPNLKFVYFCGTHGDPIAAKHVFEAVKAAKDVGAQIEMFTNGSLKTETWWSKFVGILDAGDRITFAIDGIETNHLYRQNTDVNKILKHLKIVCDSPVQTRWDYLVFKHNEHEMESSKKLAKELGVDHFRFRRTPRFDRFNPYPVIDSDGNITHYLEPPTDSEYRHPSLKEMTDFLKQIKSNESLNTLNEFKYIDKPLPNFYWKIECIYKESQKMYINSRMEVFPCCYISDRYETFKTISNAELKYPTGELLLNKKPWKEILEHDFFKELIQSWTQSNVIPRCIRTCGIVKREAEQNVRVQI
jgi:MoaA/NifB/PqqE/SkfB family radical SAM enzyme